MTISEDFIFTFGKYFLLAGIILIVLFIITTIANWKIFIKAGEKGWKSIVPFYNAYTLFRIVNMSGWNVILLIIPILNIYILVKTYIGLSRAFEKESTFAIGLIFLNPIYKCILAFGKCKYIGEILNGPIYVSSEDEDN
jgi:hypothetical protein